MTKVNAKLTVEIVPEYNISPKVHQLASQLLAESFPGYPPARSYYKLPPQFRYFVWAENELVAQMGVEHRVISNTGTPFRIFGVIDLCVSLPYRGRRIGTTLLQKVEELGKKNKVDFLVLFADDPRLYLESVYQRSLNLCRWLKVDEHQTLGIGEGSMADCMLIKRIGLHNWQDGMVDLLGYLF